MTPENRVPTKEKLAFGLGDFAINIAYTTINFWLVFFLTDVAGLKAGIAGAIYLVARIWGGLGDYMMGMISDRTSSRFGRRRVFLLYGAVPLGLTFFVIWHVPFRSSALLTTYYFVTIIVFTTCFSLVSMPYNAMMPEISQDYDERINISGYKTAMAFLGNLVSAVAVALIIDVVFGGKSHYRTSFPVVGAIFGCVIAVCLLVTFSGTRSRVRYVIEKGVGIFRSIPPTLKSMFGIHEFRTVLGLFVLCLTGIDIISAIFIYFIKHVVEVPDSYTYILMGLPLVAAVAAAPLWVYLGGKLGKRRAYIGAMTYFCLILLMSLVVPRGSVPLLVVLAIMAGVGISASQLIPFSIVPDVAEVDEYETGKRREGALYGIIMVSYKLVSGLGVAFASLMLSLSGYDSAHVTQSATTTLTLRLLLGVLPGMFFVASILFARRLTIDREGFAEICRVLEERRGAACE